MSELWLTGFWGGFREAAYRCIEVLVGGISAPLARLELGFGCRGFGSGV